MSIVAIDADVDLSIDETTRAMDMSTMPQDTDAVTDADAGVETAPATATAGPKVHVSVVTEFVHDYKRPESSVLKVFVGKTEQEVETQSVLYIARWLAFVENPDGEKIQDYRSDRRPAVRAALAYIKTPNAETHKAFALAYSVWVSENRGDYGRTLDWTNFAVGVDQEHPDEVVAKIEANLAEADAAMVERDAAKRKRDEAKAAQDAAEAAAAELDTDSSSSDSSEEEEEEPEERDAAEADAEDEAQEEPPVRRVQENGSPKKRARRG
jgi:hypothetical protein